VNTTACVLALALSSPIASQLPAIAGDHPMLAQATATPTTTLTLAEASRAAEALLDAIKQKDAERVFTKLSAPLQSTSSVKAIQARMDRRPTLNSYRIKSISPGLDDTTVEAMAVLDGQPEVPLTLVLDDNGKMLAWKWGGTTLPLEQTALNFVRDLEAERWIAARYYLDLDFQREIRPEDLKRKWSKLARVLGGVESIKSAIVASQGGEQQLVLVTIEFGTITDNLFVIFNREGRIINVDFSADLV